MKWDLDKAEGVMWIASESAKSLVGSMKDVTGINFKHHLCYVKNHRFYWCNLLSEMEEIGNFLVERFKDKKFAEKFEKDFDDFYKKSVKLLNKLDKTNFSKINNDELFEILRQANDVYIHLFDWGFVAEPMDFVMPNLIENKLKKQDYTKKEISDMFVIPYISFSNIENQELIKIAFNKEDIKEHAYKYRWIQSDHMGRKDIPLSYFEKRLKEKNLSEELEKLENFKINAIKRRKELTAKKPIDNETQILLDISVIITKVHDVRKELFLRSIYTVDTARAAIAKRYDYTKDELGCFQVDELFKLKEKKIDKKYAQELEKESLLYIDTEKGIWEYKTGEDARKIAEKEIHLSTENIKEFKGMTASPGKAEGIVKIIYSTKELDKVNKGDIIVSSMTKPEMAPALKKAVAIVTDEGGVTCHAAIVSRELGVPCIIATKIATNVLKDGDLIEVDADKGIVKIK